MTDHPDAPPPIPGPSVPHDFGRRFLGVVLDIRTGWACPRCGKVVPDRTTLHRNWPWQRWHTIEEEEAS